MKFHDITSFQKFFRNWCGGQDEPGVFIADAIRNIRGEQYGLFSAYNSGVFQVASISEYVSPVAVQNGAWFGGGIRFDASITVPTGPENVPPHLWEPVSVYLGYCA